MRIPWAVCGVCVLCTPLVAHHSFGDMYLESDSVEIEGTIVDFQYKNPHAWVFVEAPDTFGQDKIYGAEWVSTSQLERAGITKSTLKAGDRVRIWGSPSKRPTETKIHLKRMKRSDGWEWVGRGNAPR
jgi:hypothetical protein